MTAWSTLRFTRSALKHGIEPLRARHVIEHAVLSFPVAAAVDPRWDVERLLFVGDDAAGVPLEVVAIELDDGTLLVLHAMKMRRAYRPLYDQAIRALHDAQR